MGRNNNNDAARNVCVWGGGSPNTSISRPPALESSVICIAWEGERSLASLAVMFHINNARSGHCSKAIVLVLKVMQHTVYDTLLHCYFSAHVT